LVLVGLSVRLKYNLMLLEIALVSTGTELRKASAHSISKQ
jgi:hypothetical protein